MIRLPGNSIPAVPACPSPRPEPPLPPPATASALSFLFFLLFFAMADTDSLHAGPLNLVLPTENDDIFSNPSTYYMYTNRNFDGKSSQPWQGGQYGYVRNLKRTAAGLLFTKFHEGIDIRPVRRSADGTPLDDVRSISAGRVVHTNDVSSRSSYGKYVIVEHNWGSGPFYSLYAHLMTVAVKKGQTVRGGSPLGRLGYTGVGLDKTRAHVHVELNMMLSSQFERWHDRLYRSPNHHGIFNGLNLAGIDIAGLLVAHRKNPGISLPQFISSMAPYYKVVAPRRSNRLELLQRYPWLGKNTASPSPSWEITLSASGVPLRIEPAGTKVEAPVVSWVKPAKTYHTYYTRGRLTGSGSKAALTSSGRAYIDLLTGAF